MYSKFEWKVKWFSILHCKKTWDSFNPNNIHFETIFKDASMLGWKKPPWEKKSSKTKEELLRFRDLYQSSIIYSRNENIDALACGFNTMSTSQPSLCSIILR